MAIEIKGNWKKGYALDFHTKSSLYLGRDQYGHDQFDTTRTEIGQLVYDLKYNHNQTVVQKIIDIILTQIKGFEKIDVIIPVPPSKSRAYQPVLLIADALGIKTGISVIKNEIIKIRETPELKDINDPGERERILRDAFGIAGRNHLQNKSVLLVDDLYRSGSTLRAITDILYNKARVADVYVIALTKTRSKQ